MSSATLRVGAALIIISWSVAAAAAPPKVGDTAPPIAVEEVISGGEIAELSPAALHGTALVVEFWATWCGPCVGVLPHWNELVEAFEGEPIHFISVTYESAETVAGFLAGREMAGWVVLDSDRSVYRDYGIRGIPHTVLIDAEGELRAETYPSSVTVEALQALIAGEELDLPSARSLDDRIATRLEASGAPEALFLAEIRPSTDPDLRGMKMTERDYLNFGRSALDGILIAFDGRSTRLELHTELPEQLYDFVFRSPGDFDSRKSLMRTVVSDAFGITAERQPRRRRVLELRLLAGSELGLDESTPGAAGFSTYPGGIKGRGLDLTSLANALEFVAGEPILDETGLRGRFDVALEWDAGVEGDLERALTEIGLDLVASEREIEVLVVKQASSLPSP